MTKRILFAGLFVGLLDGAAACINAYASLGVLPQGVFKYIASGLLGKAAFEAGVFPIILGIVVHFLIAVTATYIFYQFYKRYGQALRPIALFGGIYGIWIWIFMNYVVIPLSLIGTYPSNLYQIVTGLLVHIFVIGVPMALLVSKAIRSAVNR
ncbi:hypothetical protein GCM10009122_25910 [Fulvivirga kasyanovii]|uniref:DUF1440 domain-containing protein n=1 Tax=Fulvivirga kasyanovii TaxID=396812 RepID=A0ABW9RHE2_9BACT|nr:hypothetical protein [Fulvivirga kasyanovii]MTI23484.1 hypothetical protein [Fulvivirga kasyanovii]